MDTEFAAIREDAKYFYMGHFISELPGLYNILEQRFMYQWVENQGEPINLFEFSIGETPREMILKVFERVADLKCREFADQYMTQALTKQSKYITKNILKK